MKDHSKKISSEYAKALKEQTRSIVKSTSNARFAGYSEAELERLPENITETSFGCGNPVAFSNIQQGQTVLDLGCGAGLDLILAAQRVGDAGQVIGVDMTDEMLIKAQKNVEDSGIKNIVLKKGRVEELPVESHSIDWVISNCVINLSPKKDEVFSEISRVLKPGGNILISDIVAEHMPWWVKKSGVLTAACAGGAIAEKDYLRKLQIAGLVECNIVERLYYEPSQIASIVVENLPKVVASLSCCGNSIIGSLLTRLVKPMCKKIWSARISARAPNLIDV